jgi:hypothetical protein
LVKRYHASLPSWSHRFNPDRPLSPSGLRGYAVVRYEDSRAGPGSVHREYVYSKHSQKKRRNKLPYGTCRLAVHDTRIVQSIFGSIQEYGGFDRPEWLG